MYKKGYLASEIATLRRARTTDPAEIESINRDEVEAYIDEAHAAPGAGARQIFLEQAATIARNRGLRDLTRRATAELERIKPDDLGLRVVRVEGGAPRHVLERWLANFVRGNDWREALEVFLATPPPTGELSDLHAWERSTRGSLRRSFSTTVLSRQALPHATTGDAEDQAHYEQRVGLR